MNRNIDRKRIYQEEVYRYEVRAQLDKVDKKKNKEAGKIWAFVNSTLFLWFLSSIVLGIISFSYAKWDRQREIEREQRERAEKLDTEISSRLTHFFYSQDIPATVTMTDKEIVETIVEVPKDSPLLKDGGVVKVVPKVKAISSHDEDYSGETANDVIPLSEDAIMSLNTPSASEYKSAYPEYANRSFYSLLKELESVVPSQEKNDISLAIDRFIKVQPAFIITLRKIRERKQDGKFSKVKINLETFSEFCGSVDLKRWGAVIPTVKIATETEIVETVSYEAAPPNSMQGTRNSAGHLSSKARARR